MSTVRIPDAGGNTILLLKYDEDKPYLLPPDAILDQIPKLPQLSLRADDVLICSYPKSGCHWLWDIVQMLLAGTTDVEKIDKEKSMLELAPLEELASLTSPRILNCHLLFRMLPRAVQTGQNKIVFIHRNPKDVAVSYYHHHRGFPEYEYSGTFQDYLPLFLEGNVDWGSAFSYLRDWEDVISNNPNIPIFVTRYEDLHSDAFQQVRKLSEFLGSSANDDLIRDIIQKCSFSQMQQQRGQTCLDMYGKNLMFRKGKVGDWKNTFTVAQNEMFDDVYAKRMNGSRFKFCYA